MLEQNAIDGRTIVMLKVALSSADTAKRSLGLADPGSMNGGELTSLWYGPDCWLLCSSTLAAGAVIDRCDAALEGELYAAVDYSAALCGYSLSGASVRDVLASGTGIDLRESTFTVGNCVRTRLAGVATIVVAVSDQLFELFVDQSYGRYMEDWIDDSSSIVQLAAAN